MDEGSDRHKFYNVFTNLLYQYHTYVSKYWNSQVYRLDIRRRWMKTS